MRTAWMLVVVAMIVLFGPGCEMQRQMEATTQEGKAMFNTLITKVPVDQGFLSADGSIHNPEVQFEGTFGQEFFIRGKYRLIGVDGDVSARGSGSGRVQVDEKKLQDQTYDILMMKDVADVERQQMWTDLGREFGMAAVAKMRAKVSATQPAEPTP